MEAEIILRAILPFSWAPWTILQLVQTLVIQDRVENALSIIHTISDAEAKSHGYSDISRSLLDMGQVAQAQTILKSAIETTEHIQHGQKNLVHTIKS